MRVFNNPDLLELEVWKDIKDFEGIYQISNHAKVKRLSRPISHWRGNMRNLPEKIIKQMTTTNGYLKVHLHKEGKMRTFSVHRLVLSHFVPNYDNLPTVNHIDGNKQNNNLDNLEWASLSRNAKNAYDIGLNRPNMGSKHNNSKVTEANVLFIRNSKQLSNKKLAEMFGITDSNITAIKKRKTWNHI